MKKALSLLVALSLILAMSTIAVEANSARLVGKSGPSQAILSIQQDRSDLGEDDIVPSFCYNLANDTVYLLDSPTFTVKEYRRGNLLRTMELPREGWFTYVTPYDGFKGLMLLNHPMDLFAQGSLYDLNLSDGTVRELGTIPRNPACVMPIPMPDGSTRDAYQVEDSICVTDEGVAIGYSGGEEALLSEGQLIPRTLTMGREATGEYRFAVSGNNISDPARLPGQVLSPQRWGQNAGGNRVLYTDLGKRGYVVASLDRNDQRVVVLDRTMSDYLSKGHVYVSSDGAVYLLLVRQGRIEIVKGEPAFIGGAELDVSSTATDSSGQATEQLLLSADPQPSPVLDRAAISQTAQNYINYTWWFNPATNKDDPSGVLQGTLPGWIQSTNTAGNLTSVPYSWGSTDSLSTFSSRMAASYQAGNIDNSTSSARPGTAGVDCAGFVWSAYNRSRIGMIKQTCYDQAQSSVQYMDPCYQPGHVVLYVSPQSSTAFNTYEANGYFGKCIVYYRQWTNYTAARMGAVMLTPNGGEVLSPGQVVNITWKLPSEAPGTVLEYSTNNGSTWQTIGTTTSKTGPYSWTVPQVSSTQIRVRAKSSNTSHASLVNDTSDASFTIALPPRVTSPNGGERWTVGSVRTITWANPLQNTNVRIDISTNGGMAWSTLVSSTPDDGVYDWTVQSPYVSTQARIRISNLSYGTFTDISDSNFTIDLPSK